MFTLHFLDDDHLMVTYGVHGLIPRVAGDPPDDDDRLVAAVVVELPSGKVVARTRWHLHDRQQYLWPLGHGFFLLRIQNQLRVIDPLHNLSAEDPFAQHAFLEVKRRIAAISISPGSDLLMIQTVPTPKPQQPNATAPVPPDAPPADPSPQSEQERLDQATQILFFRLVVQQATTGAPPELIAQSAGFLLAPHPIRLPVTSEGFLDISKESPRTWLFDFQPHAGKRLELAPFDTTCMPSPYFISRSEFVAFGCNGTDSRAEFSYFNLRGEQPWIQMLAGKQIFPIIVSAPDAGRFAFSHLQLAGTFYDMDNLTPEELTGQEILVMQNHDGRVLLKVQASPVARSGQNFDLSASGLSFAVFRGAKLDVFRLPPLTAGDQQQLKLALADVPARSDARIRLNPDRPGSDAALAVQDATPSAPVPPPSSAPQPAANLGDVQSDETRKPPSLYSPEHPQP